jgi:Uma2 family endonuclease
MISYPIREGDCTFEEFLDLVEDGQKADLLDGVIYMASPDNTDANNLLTWLAIALGGYIAARDLGMAYLNRVAYRIGMKQGPEPDFGFVPKELERLRRRGYIDGPPRLAIEIVSPDSVARDYIQKRAIYERAGVREYWILDPDEQRATFLVLRKKRYKEVKPVKNIFKSTVLPGVVLDVRWLVGSARPNPYEVLQSLLAE